MKKIILLAAALLAGSSDFGQGAGQGADSSAQAAKEAAAASKKSGGKQAAQKEWAFGDNEKLTLRVSWSAKLFPDTDVATVGLNITRRGAQHFEIYANGKTYSAVKWIFELDDHYRTTIDAATLRPVVAKTSLNEGSYRFESNMAFDWKQMVVNSTWRNLKNPNDSHKTMPLSARSYDALSLFYNMRNTDEADFRPGVRQPLDLVLEDAIRRIYFRFIGHEQVTIKKVGTFKALRFACQLVTIEGDDRLKEGSEFTMWISDDANRIPLRIESPVRVGSISARLTGFSGLKYPLESKIK
ncbi:MAG: DUF3108 domain-containing protein [Rikenellaceae bacterium]|jgi:hypothetical protein|nr:DUF3108 domain-containing protein [Rikenellaceae bacterium]